MRYRNDLTATYVKSILDYFPDTGVFKWKHRVDVPREWNARWAGREAGANAGSSHNIIIRYKAYKAHRLAWLIVTGSWPLQLIDHRDLDPLNNKWDNIREASGTDNKANIRRLSNNTSGFKGVSFYKSRNKYESYININGKRKRLGYFETAEEAHSAYRQASLSLFGEYARFE